MGKELERPSKVCIICGETFYKNRGNAGKQWEQAKTCSRSCRDERRRREATGPSEQAKAKNNARVARWKADNPERVSEHRKAERQNNKEKRLADWRDYQKRNPEKMRVRNNGRRALRAGNGGSHTVEEWQRLCETFDWRCACCGERRPLTEDHVLPISKGGTNDIDNIQPLCGSCNSRKKDKHIDYRPQWWF